MLIQNATRKFMFDEEELVDPDPNMSPEEVLEYYAHSKVELTNGSISGPEMNEDGEAVYELSELVGKKG